MKPEPRPLPTSAHIFAAALLILATAIPVLAVRIPPMIDVLGHIGRYALQTGLADHPWWQTYYSFHWQVIGNLGADLLIELLYPLLGLMGAVRAVVVLVPLLAASAIVLLSREFHGRITPHAVLALTLIYGLPFTWGFLNFSLAMALALLAFWLWVRLGRRERGATRVLLTVPIGLAVWTCHTFGWAFLGILCTAESLVRTTRHNRPIPALLATFRECLPLLAPLVPMLLWRGGASQTDTGGWFDLAQKAGWLARILRLESAPLDVLSAGVLALALYAGLRSRHTKVHPVPGLAAAIAAAAFVLMPRQIFGSVFADMRLVPYAVILALLAIRPSPRLGSWAMVAALAFVGLRLAVTTHVYREREAVVDAQMEALSVIPRHARVAMLVSLPCPSQWALPWYSHLGSLALTRKEIFVNDQWANSSMNPLTVHFPAAGEFATDDRQLFYPRRCDSPERRLSDKVQALPLDAFTHVWIVGEEPAVLPRRAGLTQVWQRGDAAVFAAGAPVHAASPAH
ncbi:hypothetical protein HNO88_002408 [Novosphingobium chloroacetimidivorans]|uniref:Glycosyltransferase RgtA/B/C/D-like domain-containing protein n=1 Tax=Novosphingobium chloroacetimidivorans TaxID=1428314 RepID=A0A7W7KA75_9SPHN|nr:hypothetical protein [Novosphingobium chloroacetimidivorans]MBB4859082.1 hypothetical protein [Novosphingobium chloroacetimidivorans]